MLGFGLLGQFAIGQGPSQITSGYVPPSGFDLPPQRPRNTLFALTFSNPVYLFTPPPPNSKVNWQTLSPELFAKPFPVQDQIFTSTPSPQRFLPGFGWWGLQLEVSYAKPFPASAQAFNAYVPEGMIPQPPTPHGFNVLPEVKFATPFAAALQQYTGYTPQGVIPIFYAPGSGKRRDFPSYIPQPPYRAKPNKVYRSPVWDKAPPGKVEQPTPAPAPTPLPPAELFASPPPAPTLDQLTLPDFSQYGHADPELDAHMNHVMDLNDAVAVMRALGILKDD